MILDMLSPIQMGILPSGKQPHNYGKSPFLISKSTINGPFSIAFCMFIYQRVNLHVPMVFLWCSYGFPMDPW